MLITPITIGNANIYKQNSKVSINRTVTYPNANRNVNFKGVDELCLAVIKNDLSGIRDEIMNGTDVNQPSSLGGNTALIYASKYGRAEAVRILLNVPGIDINIRNEQDENAFEVTNDPEIQAMLFDFKRAEMRRLANESGQNRRRDNNELNKKLLDAIDDGDREEVFDAISEGADVNARCNPDGDYAIHHALNDDEIFDELLKHKELNVNAQTDNGETALILLADYEGNYEPIRKLLNRSDIDVNIQDKLGRTALMYAVLTEEEPEQLKVIKRLLEREDLDINIQDDEGETALMIACNYKGGEAYVRELLKNDYIDFTLKDKSGRMLVDMAPINVHDEALVEEIRRRTQEQLKNGALLKTDKAAPVTQDMVDIKKLSPEENIWNKEQITAAFAKEISYGHVKEAQEILSVTPYVDFEANDRALLKKVCTLGDPDFVHVVFDYQANQPKMKEEYEAKRKEFFDEMKNLSYEDLKKNNLILNTPDGFRFLMSKEEFNPNDIAGEKSLFEIACVTDNDLAKEILSKYDNVSTKNAKKTNNVKTILIINEYESRGKYQVLLANIKKLLSKPETIEDGVQKIKNYLASKDCRMDLSDEMGNNLLHIISGVPSDNTRGVIQKLVDGGLDINAKNIAGQTPLMTAIKQLIVPKNTDEKEKVLSNIKFVIDKGSKIDEQDSNGQTAFHYACMTTSAALLGLILSKRPNVFLQDMKGNPPSKYLKTEETRAIFKEYIGKLL